MKTAQRILTTALALFNQYGEASISSVDIANECDISPGNLYYHFKGKEQLVDGLMKLHRAQMDELLDNKRVLALHMDEFFYYCFDIIQRIHLFRFLYRSPADLSEKYPNHSKQHKRFIQQLEQCFTGFFEQAVKQQVMQVNNTSSAQLSNLCCLIITQSSGYQETTYVATSRSGSDHPDIQQYRVLSLLLAALSPRCALSQSAMDTLQSAIQEHQL